jgi:hypothetical protein
MDTTGKTFGDIIKANPEIFDIWVPKNKPFDKPGRYTVVVPGSMNTNDTMEIEVYEDGGFTILNYCEDAFSSKPIK